VFGIGCQTTEVRNDRHSDTGCAKPLDCLLNKSARQQTGLTAAANNEMGGGFRHGFAPQGKAGKRCQLETSIATISPRLFRQ